MPLDPFFAEPFPRLVDDGAGVVVGATPSVGPLPDPDEGGSTITGRSPDEAAAVGADVATAAGDVLLRADVLGATDTVRPSALAGATKSSTDPPAGKALMGVPARETVICDWGWATPRPTLATEAEPVAADASARASQPIVSAATCAPFTGMHIRPDGGPPRALGRLCRAIRSH